MARMTWLCIFNNYHIFMHVRVAWMCVIMTIVHIGAHISNFIKIEKVPVDVYNDLLGFFPFFQLPFHFLLSHPPPLIPPLPSLFPRQKRLFHSHRRRINLHNRDRMDWNSSNSLFSYYFINKCDEVVERSSLSSILFDTPFVYYHGGFVVYSWGLAGLKEGTGGGRGL